MPSLSHIRTTIITPPAVTDLALAETVLMDWGIDGANEPFISRAITRCSGAAEDYCNRRFGIAKYQFDVRLERGYRDGHLTLGANNPIMVHVWPIASVVSITETDENGTATSLVENTDYEVDNHSGQIYRLDSSQRQRDWWPTMRVKIVCWSGYILPGDKTVYTGASNLPSQIEDAVGRMAATRYFESNRNPFVKSESVVGVGTIDYRDSGSGPDSGNLSPDVLDILTNFRMPVVG